MSTVPHHPAPLAMPARRCGRSGERRSGRAQQGVLAAVVALALCASLVVVQHEAPALDASAARHSLAVLDEWLLAAHGSEQR